MLRELSSLARRVVERVDALHHVRLLQLTADLGGGGALLDLVEHRALARARVVGRRSEPAAELVECPATAEHRPRPRPRGPARSAPDRSHGAAGAVDLGLVVRDAREELVFVVPVVEAVVRVEGGVQLGSRSGFSPAPGPVWLNAVRPTRSWPRRGPAPRRTRRSAVPARGLPARSRRQRPWSTTARRFLPLRPCAPQLPLGSHRAQALVAQPDRDRLHPVGQVTRERSHLTGRRSFTPGHRARQADVDADRAELLDERRQPVEVALAARHGLHRGGEDARRDRCSRPRCGRRRGRSRGVRRRARSPIRTELPGPTLGNGVPDAARASAARLASAPPPCATSSLPPPLPPRTSEAARTRVFAERPAVRAGVVDRHHDRGLAARRSRRSRRRPDGRQASGCGRRARGCVRRRRPRRRPRGPRRTRRTGPRQLAASSPPAASSCCRRTFSISFSAARRRSTMSLTRSGSCSGRTLRVSLSWATSTCSRARKW